VKIKGFVLTEEVDLSWSNAFFWSARRSARSFLDGNANGADFISSGRIASNDALLHLIEIGLSLFLLHQGQFG
jgi:hypothetical protein